MTRSGSFQRAKIAHFKGLVPRCGAGSTGQRNTRAKTFCWSLKPRRIAWSFVEAARRLVEILLGV